MLPRFSIASRRRTITPAARHRARAARERHAHDGRQQLGRDAYGQGDGEQQRFDDRTIQHMIDRQHEHHHDDHHAHEQVAELPDAAREFRLRSPLVQARGDGAEGRVAPGLYDEHRRSPAAHGRAEEDAIGAAGERRVGATTAGFLDRKRFAGQARFGHQEVLGFEDHAVRRHQVAGRELDHIAGNDRAGRRLSVRPVTHHLLRSRRGAGAVPRLRHCARLLLHEAEQRCCRARSQG